MWGAPSERRPKQAIDLRPVVVRQSLDELELHESHEERVEGASSCQQLLRNLGERLACRDHRGEGGCLAARALGVSDSRAAILRARYVHGVT